MTGSGNLTPSPRGTDPEATTFLRGLAANPVCWLGVLLTAACAAYSVHTVRAKAQADFENRVQEGHLAINARVGSYIDVLRGTWATFSMRPEMTRREFHIYATNLGLANHYPGIETLNFAVPVPHAKKAEFEQAVRRDTGIRPDGHPNFRIKPEGTRPEYHVLTLVEPFDRFEHTLGHDLTHTDYIAKVVASTRDTGRMTSSGRIIRFQSDPLNETRLAVRIPVYRPGMPTSTVGERRAAYVGSVGAGFNVDQVMAGVFSGEALSVLRVKLYDGGPMGDGIGYVSPGSSKLLYERKTADASSVTSLIGGGHFVKRVPVQFAERVWEAEFSVDVDSMVGKTDQMLPWFVLAAGLSLTLLLYGIYFSLQSAKRRALGIASEMTQGLRASEANLAEAQQIARLGSWTHDCASGRMIWSGETFRILGIERSAQNPTLDDLINCVFDLDRDKFAKAVKDAAAGTPFECAHRILHSDGTIHWVQTAARLTEEHGRPLLRGTIMDITDRMQIVEALEQSRSLLRELTVYQERIREEERKRIAREIHDELGQTLLALRIDVSLFEARTGNAHPRLNERAKAALATIDATVRTVRSIINNLRPSVLDLGLNAAIEWQVSEFRRRYGIECHLHMEEIEMTLDDSMSTTVFRALQESLTNVVRHAQATRVDVTFHCDDRGIFLRIADNGIGVEADAQRKVNSFGLLGIRERISAVGGTLNVDGEPGVGTRLTLRIPVRQPELEA